MAAIIRDMGPTRAEVRGRAALVRWAFTWCLVASILIGCSPARGTVGADGGRASGTDPARGREANPLIGGLPPSAGSPALPSPPSAAAAEGPPEPLELAETIEYPLPGVLVDDRAPWRADTPSDSMANCDQLRGLVLGRQRTTLGQGVQLSLSLRDPAGFPLSSAAYAGCLTLRDSAGEPLTTATMSASASGALTLVLAQPGSTAEENRAITQAASLLFRSRPQGERLAFFRWGSRVEQVASFTSFRDTFADAINRGFPVADGTTAEVSEAIAVAGAALSAVADNSHLWTRNLMVLAPHLRPADIIAGPPDVNVSWLTNDIAGSEAFNRIEVDMGSLGSAVASLSARLDEYNRQGFVTFGLCGAGRPQLGEVRVGRDGLRWPVELIAAKEEEQVGSCSPAEVASFVHHAGDVIELSVEGDAKEQHERLIADSARSGDGWRAAALETFGVSVKLSPQHGVSRAVAHLRGSSSLRDCAPNRVSYTVDLEGGRERYLLPESAGAVGSDEFYLIAMCLDRMYLNQLTAQRLMHEVGVFRPAFRLIELRVQGETNGVYILMEKVKESLVRNHSGVMSVIRRRNEGPEVKFPSEDDGAAAKAAADSFEDLGRGLRGLSATERLAYLAPRLDLHRYMFFVALQSLLENGDWGDEPSFFATQTLRDGEPAPFFTVNGWDADDLLAGCDHEDDVIEDPAGLIGCAEHEFDKALFGGDAISDDDVYRTYVDALSMVIDYFTPERVGAAFDRTAAELEPFTRRPDIRAVMEWWSDVDDVPAAMAEAVSDRKLAFAERRALLQERLEAFYADHP
jgi:hypothetical protein